MSPSLLQSKETHLQSLLMRNGERERARATTPLSRSKSVGSLQNSTGSIETLKALFEAKAKAQLKPKASFKTGKVIYTADKPMMNGEAEDVQCAPEKPIKPAENKFKKEPKDDFLTQKVKVITLLCSITKHNCFVPTV